MAKIPDTNKKFSQPNNSDLFGNIYYSKNINFDEEGYIKLSSRTASFYSEKNDSAFDLPIALGRLTGGFHVVTADSAYDLSLLETDFSMAKDVTANTPTLTFDSHGCWFQNRWHASTTDKIWYETTVGSGWTDSTVSLTAGKVHVMEVFRNKNSLAVSNGNTVLLLNTSYSTTVTLTLPADFEVVGLSYSNAKMAIITKLSDSVGGQNQEAFIFFWDGTTTSAVIGTGLGSDMLVSIIPYKSSWAILTRTGELKYYNGGGFDPLASFPFYFQQTNWGDATNRNVIGNCLSVEGDLIYINIGNDLDIFGKNGESYLENFPAGIWCYDPSVGLYHRYSHSNSIAYEITALSAGVNTTTDVITKTTGTLPVTGNPIKQISQSTSALGGVKLNKVYYIIKHTASTFSLAETKADAEAGNKVDITSAGDVSFVAIDLIDYSASRVIRTGGIGVVETYKEIADHLIFGGEIYDTATTSDYTNLCLTIPRFENRGAIVIPKLVSQNKEDNTQNIIIKYRPLDVDDKIIVKYKDKDVLEIPTATPQFSNSINCTWSDANTFTTTANLSSVYNYLQIDGNECEVEIISGAGAGQMAQISSISYLAGTYTVNLSENIDGASSARVCDVLINNWKLLGTIDYTNTDGLKEFVVNTSAKWVLTKIELRGYETTLEEADINKVKQL